MITVSSSQSGEEDVIETEDTRKLAERIVIAQYTYLLKAIKP